MSECSGINVVELVGRMIRDFMLSPYELVSFCPTSLQGKLVLVGQWLGRQHFGHAYGIVTIHILWLNACSILSLWNSDHSYSMVKRMFNLIPMEQ